MRMRTVIYRGSVDPFTNGHLDLVQRAVKLFDHVIVAVAKSDAKSPLFTLEERLDLVRQSTRDIPNVSAEVLDGLLVEYGEQRGGQAVVSVLGAVSGLRV